MTQYYNYKIFDWILKSSIELPELIPFQGRLTSDHNSIIFTRRSCSNPLTAGINWFHEWHQADGRISISCGKREGLYYLRFPNIVDFEINISENSISGFPMDGADEFSLRHLLLDQVIPRLLSHQGHLIFHASAVCVNDMALLFFGETGQGKSTIAMVLQQYGYPLLTDDCVKLEITNNHVACIPNYLGMRLWPDSVTGLSLQKDQYFVNNGRKTRLYLGFNGSPLSTIPVKAFFFLDAPKPECTNLCACHPVTGSEKFIELTKHCFPLDITDRTFTRKQFENIARIWKSENILFFNISYPRIYSILPALISTILSACSEPPTPDNGL